MRVRVVCDTNILISALISPGGSPDKVVSLARTGQIELYVSSFIMDEFERVLTQKFNYDQDEVKRRSDRIVNISTVVDPSETVAVVSADEPDNRVLECALVATADFIVSGDKHLLELGDFQQIPIIRAAELLFELSK